MQLKFKKHLKFDELKIMLRWESEKCYVIVLKIIIYIEQNGTEYSYKTKNHDHIFSIHIAKMEEILTN